MKNNKRRMKNKKRIQKKKIEKNRIKNINIKSMSTYLERLEWYEVRISWRPGLAHTVMVLYKHTTGNDFVS